MERRQFVILAAAGSASTLALEGCGASQEYAEPLAVANDKYVPGADYWRATVCGQCAAGCGVIVRTRDGNANKIEGNPLHPVSRGKLCARGQAGLNELYNPDRIRGPLKRVGERGAGRFEEITWEEAIKTVAGRLNELRAGGEAGAVAWVEGRRAGGEYRALLGRFMRAYGSGRLAFDEPFSRAVERRAGLATYDLAGADFVLSFGARFLETWGSPLYYSRGFGEMRRSRRRRGRFVHAEPRLSLTAASADEWLPVKPGSEGYLAMTIAAAVARPDGFEAGDVEAVTGISPRTVTRLARELAESEAVAVLAGGAAAAHTNGPFNLEAIDYLRGLVKGAGRWPTAAPAAESAPDALGPGVKLLLLHAANLLYHAPEALKLRDALAQIPMIVSFSPFEDETAAHADLILPDHTTFERWDDDEPEEGAPAPLASLAQPIVEPLYQTRHTGDVLLEIARQVPALAAEFKAASFLDLLKQARLKKADDEEGWTQAVLRGGFWDEGEAKPAAARAAGKRPAQLIAAQFAGDEKEYPFHFLPYEHLALGDGRTANQPLLQELPDPLTAVSWGSWVEINPRTAEQLGVGQGDLVAVESPHGRVDAPVVIYPGIRPDVIAMPAGQGHERYGRYASGRGANPLKILAPLAEPQTGALAWAATRVRVRKAEGRGRLVTVGTNERLLEGREDLRR